MYSNNQKYFDFIKKVLGNSSSQYVFDCLEVYIAYESHSFAIFSEFSIREIAIVFMSDSLYVGRLLLLYNSASYNFYLFY